MKSLSELLHRLHIIPHSTHKNDHENVIAIGSETMHDAGLTDDEVTGRRSPSTKASARKEHYIKHNDLLPEEKITLKQRFKTPV